jgi:hypothetical protein
LVFNRNRVSLWEVEEVLEIDSGNVLDTIELYT